MAWTDKFVTRTEKKDTVVEVKPTAQVMNAATVALGFPSAPAAVKSKTAMDYTLEEVFASGGAATGRNSADTVIKLRDSLSSFTAEQQLVMLRAMDSADDSWDETTVIADAKRRIIITDEYQRMVSEDEANRVAKINEDCSNHTRGRRVIVEDIDAQIAELQANREKEIAKSEDAVAVAAEQVSHVKNRADGYRASAAAVAAKYKEIINFFGK